MVNLSGVRQGCDQLPVSESDARRMRRAACPLLEQPPAARSQISDIQHKCL